MNDKVTKVDNLSVGLSDKLEMKDPDNEFKGVKIEPITSINFRRLFIFVFQYIRIRSLIVYIPDNVNEVEYAQKFCKNINARFINIVPAVIFNIHTINNDDELLKIFP